MLSLDESWTCHLRASALWLQSSTEVFNLTQGLGHTHLSNRHSLDTRFNYKVWSIITQALLRVVQSDLQDTTSDTTDSGLIIFKNDLQFM